MESISLFTFSPKNSNFYFFRQVAGAETIELDADGGLGPGSVGNEVTVNGQTLTIISWNGAGTEALKFGGTVQVASITLSNGVTYYFSSTDLVSSIGGEYRGSGPVLNPNASIGPFVVIPCFVKGAMIGTPYGERRVEALRTGDLVSTRDRGAQPIRWIGNKRLSAARIAASPHLRPVTIPAGSLSENAPRRDLRLSPQHRVVVKGGRAELLFGAYEFLAPAKSLSRKNSAERDETIYYHLIFDQHEIIYAEGAEVESLHPGECALGAFDVKAREELFEIFPELETDLAAYGPTCLPVLTAREARALAVAY